MKILASVLITFVLFLSVAFNAQAATAPKFTSCVNPQGEIVAQYAYGTHGIAGKTASFEGSDAVYKLSGDALTQCFCSSNGTGIQTDWWKVSSLTSEEIDLLKSQGWIYIPIGALWGLSVDPYLTLNSEFVCKSGPNGGSGGSSNGSYSGSSSSNGGNGGVLGAAVGGVGSVLGLASTGNTKLLYSIFTFSVLALLSGVFLKFRAKKLTK